MRLTYHHTFHTIAISFSMATKDYSRLSIDSTSQESTAIEDELRFEDEIRFLRRHHGQPHSQGRKGSMANRSLLLLLVTSLLISNGIWTWLALHHQAERSTQHTSTRLKSLHWDTPYSSDNKTAANVLWKDLFPGKSPTIV